MIIYNVTIKIDKKAEADWRQWMQSVHIPDVLKTGLFENHRFCKILHEEPDGSTYAIQYECRDMPTLEKYIRDHSKALQAEHSERYKDRYVAIRTLMETVE